MSNIDTADLLALEAKIGRTFTRQDWTTIRRKSVETLSDADLIVIEAFEGTASAQGLRTRRQPAPPPSTPAPTSARMNEKTRETLATSVADVMKKAIDGPQVAGRISALEARIAALEAKPSVKFCGTWERGKSYAIGDAATHQGGLWVCQADTTGEPSKDFVGWKLAVKRGHA